MTVRPAFPGYGCGRSRMQKVRRRAWTADILFAGHRARTSGAAFEIRRGFAQRTPAEHCFADALWRTHEVSKNKKSPEYSRFGTPRRASTACRYRNLIRNIRGSHRP